MDPAGHSSTSSVERIAGAVAEAVRRTLSESPLSQGSRQETSSTLTSVQSTGEL